MSAAGRSFVVKVAIGAAVATVAAVIVHGQGYRINETASLPPGIWQIAKPSSIERGQIINFCPPASPALIEAKARGYLTGGTCQGDLESMFKPVVAIAGDRVDVSDAGVFVNGQLIAASAPVAVDGMGRPMPRPTETGLVASDTVWVISSYSPLSFDSRYFGAIPTSTVLGVARPVWIGGNHD